MTCSVEGLLHNSLDCQRRDKPFGPAFYRAGLDAFIVHLRELRDRHASGDTGVVAEFFELYKLDEKIAESEGEHG